MSLSFSSMRIKVGEKLLLLGKGTTNFDPGSDECEADYRLDKALTPNSELQLFLNEVSLPLSCMATMYLRPHDCAPLSEMEMTLNTYDISPKGNVTLRLEWLPSKKK